MIKDSIYLLLHALVADHKILAIVIAGAFLLTGLYFALPIFIPYYQVVTVGEVSCTTQVFAHAGGTNILECSSMNPGLSFRSLDEPFTQITSFERQQDGNNYVMKYQYSVKLKQLIPPQFAEFHLMPPKNDEKEPQPYFIRVPIDWWSIPLTALFSFVLFSPAFAIIISLIQLIKK